MGSRYLVGYIGDISPQAQWLGEKDNYWTRGIQILEGVVCKHPQAA